MKFRSADSGHRFRTLAIACLVVLASIAVGLFALRSRKIYSGFSDLHARDGLSHNETWVGLGGEWTVRSAEVENNSDERGAKLLSRGSNLGDYQVQADLRMTSPSGMAGLIIRSSAEEEGVDSYHGYFAGISPMESAVTFGRADFGWRPLLNVPLPSTEDNLGWIHLKLIAVGCKFGVAARLPDGQTTSASIDDRDCIRSGRFGLRSYLTGATWRNIEVSTATFKDLNGFHSTDPSQASNDFFLSAPADPGRLDRYISSMRKEAKKHEIPQGVEPISDFPVSPGRYSNITIQGVIISRPPLAMVQDETGAMVIANVDPTITLKPGDYVEAHGTVITDHFRSTMEDAHLMVLWSDAPVPPLFVTVSQLMGGTYRGRSIQVEGTLVSRTFKPSGYELVLHDGNQYFRATGAKAFGLDPSELELGSRIRVKGIATSLSEFTNNLYPFAVVTERIDLVSPPPWWSPIHLVWLTVIGVAIFVCAQLMMHKLQAWHMRSILKEREELALEMHDTLAQSFAGIAYQLQAASTERRGIEKVQAHLRNALAMVQMSHKEASRTIAALRPQYRDTTEILAALKEAAERLSDGAVLVITTLSGRSVQLPLQITDALFRIGQEAISNAIQHSRCNKLAISLHLSKREVQLCVEDDGQGFSDQSVVTGLGITGMQARAAKTKARFELATEPGAGTKITVTAPLPLGHGLLYRLRAMLVRAFAGATSG